ncbi:MAG: tRNA (N6-isopentenyl adenosine(37)-C2)-methylthiotransferase MiaB [Hyphomicrobium sp.]|nr:tRNA (N6-isopentenyl adenosine(37)-C2)-methylthiotransferase MiaB [Hyphomicrobium sp.]
MTAETVAKKVFIKTFGCQMNVYDSERITEALAGDGYAETAQIEDADLVILNTCHIREKAVEKVYSDLGRIRDVRDQRRREGKDTLVSVAGCVAQAEGAEISRRAPVVDLVVGPQSYHRLPELLQRRTATGERLVETAFPDDEKFTYLSPKRQVRSATAFLTIQEGCDKFCTFCVVPYTRGMEYSRSVAELEKEARTLVENGARELTLLGQNVNAYHGVTETGSETSLAGLIRRLAGIDGLERIRYMTSHPRNMSDDLIIAHAEVPNLMPYLHLPVQSGSDRILAAMNRKHTAEDYLRVVERIRAARPDIALSTDMIVGFPGETEQDFDETLQLVKAVGFAQSYSFKYSARPGTPAANMDDQVPEALKSERLARLQYVLNNQHEQFNAATVGQTMPVLFERMGRSDGQLVGRSPYLQLVQARADAALLGKILPVSIRGYGPGSLSGVVAV